VRNADKEKVIVKETVLDTLVVGKNDKYHGAGTLINK